jgi:predicted Rossmann fold nucleotide-binding protein DprA/Smf involved in DNA uptake
MMTQYFLGVVGGRDFTDYDLLEKEVDDLIKKNSLPVCIVSGGAAGADSLAEKYATEKGLETVVYKPDWSLGKRAGPLRNQKIVNGSDEVIAFWDGKSPGTKSTIQLALSAGKRVHVVAYDNSKPNCSHSTAQ